jgi:hypothetical protein
MSHPAIAGVLIMRKKALLSDTLGLLFIFGMGYLAFHFY